jgi:hypothetical protein
MNYKLIKYFGEVTGVIRLDDGAQIPITTENGDYRAYLKWLDGYELQYNAETTMNEWVKTSDGNTPGPADE